MTFAPSVSPERLLKLEDEFLALVRAGFPPIREIFEDFFQSGKSGKNWGFSAKSRKKFSHQGTSFQNHFQTF